MQQKLMRNTVIYSIIFAIAAMSVVLYAAAHKRVEIADVAQDEAAKGNAVSESLKDKKTELTFEEGEKRTNYLCIPLKARIKAEAVTIENHYMEQELWVVLDGDYAEFYSQNKISGSREKIETGYYEKAERKTYLKFSLNGIFECRSILEENQLYIEWVPPKEMYNKIIVIDPAGGNIFGKENKNLLEKNITLSIAKKLKEKLDATDIKVYYTRMNDVYVKEESRTFIANGTKADMLIRIQVSEENDSGIYGTSTVYNENFFIPGFGSIELADLLEREVVTSISGKAIGLIPAQEDDYVISETTVPAAAINVGCITNAQEAILLQREDYLDKIADGIYQAILKAYERS